MPGMQATDAVDEQRKAAPSWNNSTTVIQILHDRLVSHGWSTGAPVKLAVGPATELDERPLDLGVGLWR